MRSTTGAYPIVEYLKGPSLGYATASNIRLGRKILAGTITLAYYEHLQIAGLKVL
jgi:hypothetical protein